MGISLHLLPLRCQSPEQCVPVFDQSNTITLPVVGSDDPLLIRGKCIAPCETSCGSDPMNLQCGRSGLTYYNSCYRECANELVSAGYTHSVLVYTLYYILVANL